MGISIWQVLIVLLIVVLLFGTKKLRTFGSDLGEAVKGFKKGMGVNEEEANLTNKPESIDYKNDDASDAVTAQFTKTESSAR